MREIKFRAWDKVENRMFNRIEYIGFIDEVIHLRSINIRSDDMLMSFKGDRYQDNVGSYKDIDFEDIELMQYTCLKDKNGVEIYEGDIILYDYNNLRYRIEFLNSEFIARRFYENIENLYPTEFDYGNEVEVIGNIYENPELLKDNI